MKRNIAVLALVVAFTASCSKPTVAPVPADAVKEELGGRKNTGSGDILGELMGNSTVKTDAKTKHTAKPLSEDIDMGSGDSPRSKQEVMQVVEARMPALKSIYSKRLEQNPSFSGTVTVKFTIAQSGEITHIAITSSSTGNPEFDDDIKNKIATWKWKAISEGETTPTIPFSFTE